MFGWRYGFRVPALVFAFGHSRQVDAIVGHGVEAGQHGDNFQLSFELPAEIERRVFRNLIHFEHMKPAGAEQTAENADTGIVVELELVTGGMGFSEVGAAFFQDGEVLFIGFAMKALQLARIGVHHIVRNPCVSIVPTISF